MQEPCHFVIDACNISPELLKSVTVIGDYIQKTCYILGLTCTGGYFIEKFSGGGEGITAAQCLKESLFSLHTYPETGSIYIDVFSCKSFDTLQFISFTQNYFGTKSMFAQRVNRLSLSEIRRSVDFPS